MLYCPKCNQSYEDGTQRFCTNDSARLIPAPGSGGQPRSVFTNVLNRASVNKERSTTFKEVPVLINPEQNTISSPASQQFVLPGPADLVSTEPEDSIELLELDSDESEIRQIAKPEMPLPPPKPIARMIKPEEVPASQAILGDRAVNPSGRAALSWENPEVLIGQTVKGRYAVSEKLGEDETGIIYLAEDRISDGKKVVVRVLMEEDADDLSSRILAEERVSLSHVNHPNVAKLFDSGELHEGFPFIITEYVAGGSLKEKLGSGDGQFNLQRAARIIRQAASAVGEAHRNGVLHRSLKPKNIILGTTEAGAEQVKVTDFGVFDGFEIQDGENSAYLAPEQLQENYPTAASDIYSLAVIAFQLLTGRVPFEFSTAKELSKAQKEKLRLLPTNLRLDAPPLVDEILEKALAYDPAKRYPKARDFGDAFFNALTTNPPSAWKEQAGKSKADISVADSKTFAISKPLTSLSKDIETAPENPSIEKPEIILPGENLKAEPERGIDKVKATDGLAWEKRSPEQIKPVNAWRVGSIVLGIVMLSAVVWGIWNYFLHRPEPSVYVSPKTETAQQNTNAPLPDTANKVNAEPSVNGDAPPIPRAINQPPDTIFFQNSKNELKGDLAKNFRGFSFYYPKDWSRNSSPKNFADVARVGATGTPIEQMLIGYYESRGTLTTDTANFPKLVEKSDKDLSAIISDYKTVSSGETTINGWKAYEVKFQGSGKTVNGDKITLWGRRLWIPPARLDVKTGFLITMLATSNSPEVKSAEDVGVKGELPKILETFEPVPLDTGY